MTKGKQMSFAITSGVASLAMGGIGMIGGAQTSGIQGAASRKAAEEQTKQSKLKQEELNANSELSRQIQKINNARIMGAADKTFAAAATNLQRNRASRQTSGILQQLAQAEAVGAYTANTASKGIGGASADIIENTMRLRDSMKQQLTDTANSQADYDQVQQLAGIIPAGWGQQDMTVITGGVSAAASVPAVTGGFNWAAAVDKSGLMGYLGNLLDKTPKKPYEVAGSGLKLPGGDIGLSASKGGFWKPTGGI
jgi:hypothetical protein